ncbi:MAG: hypothetical protein P4L50_23570 [Anaerolineaceae bacterium]|nr:hypothetical protein [Anaerolineaceae bacterium]
MIINKIPVTHTRSKKLLPLALLIAMFLATACGSAGVVPAAAASVLGNNNATTNQGVTNVQNSTAVPAAAVVPAAQGSGTIDCQVMGNAYMDFVGQYSSLNITSDAQLTAAFTPGNPFYLDIPKLHSDLALFATLPDGKSFGKVSPAIAMFNQFIDTAESDFKSGKVTFSGGNSDGQEMLSEYLKLVQPYTVLADAFGTACPNYSAPVPTSGPTSPNPADDPAMKTEAAAGSSMLATVSAMTTAAASNTNGTPAP